MNSGQTYSFYNESVCSLGLPVEPNHRPNNPIPEANAEFTILIPTYNNRTQTPLRYTFKLSIHYTPYTNSHKDG